MGGVAQSVSSERRVKTFLVTGGCGFIGSHLTNALLERGARVRVLDDLSTGKRANLPARAELLLGDVADPAIVRQAIAGVAGCFHLAAVASVQRSVEDWLGTHRTNLTGTITLFDAIRRCGRKLPVVYASSAAVYGDCPTLPITEDAERRPLSAYGADKLGCELHARVADHVHGIPATGLRFFNVYGPRQDPRSPYSGVISIFCERILGGKSVDIFGDGQQTRDFIHVSDVVAALVAAMRLAAPGAPVFNVCTGQATTVLALAQTIAELTQNRPEIRLQPPRSGEIRHSLGSRDRAAPALGLGSPKPLRDGLANVLDWLASKR
jgi:UDP-glucose 4-epimerase